MVITPKAIHFTGSTLSASGNFAQCLVSKWRRPMKTYEELDSELKEKNYIPFGCYEPIRKGDSESVLMLWYDPYKSTSLVAIVNTDGAGNLTNVVSILKEINQNELNNGS